MPPSNSLAPSSTPPITTVQDNDNDDDSLPLDPTSPVISTSNLSSSLPSPVVAPTPPSTSPDDPNSISLSGSAPESKSSSVHSHYQEATSMNSLLKTTSTSLPCLPLSPQLPDLSKILVQFCFTHPILESFLPHQQFIVSLHLDGITEIPLSSDSSDSYYFCLKPGWKFDFLLPKFLADIQSFFTLWQLPTNLFYKFKNLVTNQSAIDSHFNFHADCFLPTVDKPKFGILRDHHLIVKFWD